MSREADETVSEVLQILISNLWWRPGSEGILMLWDVMTKGCYDQGILEQ